MVKLRKEIIIFRLLFIYYSLIYVKFMRERDPIRAKRFTERAVMFAQDYLYYFDEEGEALPYGRSQTYRFAQGAFSQL